jgi:ribosomal protein S18 acetylase RimI-like enzyme
VIVDVPVGERIRLERILEESFEGLYLRHSKKTLLDAEVVRAAVSSGTPVGLAMLKMLDTGVGYVFYIAVATAYRRTGVAGMLLDDALRYLKDAGAKEAYAGVEEENAPSERLFASRGFVRTSFGDVSKRYGSLHALNMYRMMLVVPGEVLLYKDLT